MYSIYCIKNLINNKMYVGKTKYSDINKRFKEHISDSSRERCKNRPLYRAINKYGRENFEIFLLEAVEEELSCERESYWIKELNTYGSAGYNATTGGDGKPYVDEALVLSKYKELGFINKVADCTGYHKKTISDILKRNNIKTKNNIEVAKKILGKEVYMCDEFGNELMDFDSLSSASEYIINFIDSDFENARKRIGQCCLGNLKSYKGTYWKYKLS